MPSWSSVLDVVLSWWTPLVLVAVGGPFVLVEELRKPVLRAPWAGVSWWQRSVFVLLPVFWVGDALDPESGRGLPERWTKGLLVSGMLLLFVVTTARWVAAGRPDEPLPVDDDDDDDDDEDEDEDEPKDR